jgi:hypothetical protein
MLLFTLKVKELDGRFIIHLQFIKLVITCSKYCGTIYYLAT